MSRNDTPTVESLPNHVDAACGEVLASSVLRDGPDRLTLAADGSDACGRDASKVVRQDDRGRQVAVCHQHVDALREGEPERLRPDVTGEDAGERSPEDYDVGADDDDEGRLVTDGGRPAGTRHRGRTTNPRAVDFPYPRRAVIDDHGDEVRTGVSAVDAPEPGPATEPAPTGDHGDPDSLTPASYMRRAANEHEHVRLGQSLGPRHFRRATLYVGDEAGAVTLARLMEDAREAGLEPKVTPHYSTATLTLWGE